MIPMFFVEKFITLKQGRNDSNRAKQTTTSEPLLERIGENKDCDKNESRVEIN